MLTAVFLLLPSQSHCFSCFAVARELQRNGFSVVFTGTASEKELIHTNGFEFYEFKYLPTYEVRTFKGFLGRLFVSLLSGNAIRQRFKEFKYHIDQVYEMLSVVKPRVIFIDEHLSHYFPYIRPHVNACYMLNTKLASGKSMGIPPFNSFYVPGNNFFDKVYCELIWARHLFYKRIARVLTTVAFLGKPNEYFQKRFLRRLKSNVMFTDRTSMYDYDNVIDAVTYQLMSDAFDFPWRKRRANEINLHFWNTRSDILSSALTAIIHANSANKPIVYCGLGTMAGRNFKDYAQFLTSLTEVWNTVDNGILIISTGHAKLTSLVTLTKKVDHLYVFDHVPQQALLPHCSVMITHGGLNSVKECIHATVPMLGILNAAHRHTDTRGNIARIVHWGIGLHYKITDKPQVLANVIDQLLTDPKFKRNIVTLQEKINVSEKGTAHLLSTIKG